MQNEMEPSANEQHDGFHAQVCREPLLDSHQAAALLKVHPRTLQRLVHRGNDAIIATTYLTFLEWSPSCGLSNTFHLWRFRCRYSRHLWLAPCFFSDRKRNRRTC